MILIARNAPRIIGVLLGTALCTGLIAIKIILFQEANFDYLIWNLFLAWVPLILALSIKKFQNWPVQIVVVLLWLLFLPNSPYLITDLIHLNERHLSANWSDAMVIFIAALTGLSTGIVSLRIVHKWIQNSIGPPGAYLSMIVVFVLTGYGIFLGRIQRWNSWDLFTRPTAVLSDAFEQLNNPQAINITVTFSLFLAILYYTTNEQYKNKKSDDKAIY